MIQKEQEVDHHDLHHHPYHEQVRQHVEEKVLALQMSLRELQTGVEGLGPLQTGDNDTDVELFFCSHFFMLTMNEFLKADSLTHQGCPNCARVWAKCTRRWRQKSTHHHHI